MSEHTPGPWEYRGHAWVQTADDKKTPIANFNFYAATEANARLIAAAPELLEALERIANGPWPDWINCPEAQCRFDEQIARAAIAKATGEQV